MEWDLERTSCIYILYAGNGLSNAEEQFNSRTNLAFVSAKVWHNRLEHLSLKKFPLLNVLDSDIPKCNKMYI